MASSQLTVWSSKIDDGLVQLVPDQPDAELPSRNESVWTTPSRLLHASRLGSQSARIHSLRRSSARLIQLHCLGHHLYDDSTQFIDSVKTVYVGTNINRLQLCNQEITRWCASRQLQLNPVKNDSVWYDLQT